MDDLLTKLGCKDIELTKARFLNDREFYLEVTRELLEDPGFEQLGEQLQKQEQQRAFDTAHMLKGTIGNCGVTPLYKLITQIVDPLRGKNPDYSALLKLQEQLLKQRDVVKKTLEAYT